MSGFTLDDIRAAVNAGAMTEAQATKLITIAQSRQNVRDFLPEEDEPFEFFKGFSEIFVTVGLGLLFAGVLAITVVLGSGAIVPIAGMALCWVFAMYFTARRRMSLPSIALAAGFGIFLAFGVALIIGPETEAAGLAVGLIGMAAMALYYRVFKLPFSMFVLGVFGLIFVFSVINHFTHTVPSIFFLTSDLFDLGNGTYLAYGSLVFGIAAFLAGLYFDLRDPHRISRYSASGFWLHILAAPALVNTIAMSLFNVGGTVGYSLTALALLLVTIVALVIDRRSFLTAGIGYVGVLILYALQNSTNEETSFVATLLILGVFITALGTWWVQIRASLMRALPDFPLKDRLPPYTSANPE
ncbi:hypothetical protein OU789_13850 [Halocynthiibacter sp. C4]|uniref:hypothetical protein n=1 Tax=Halocynthiibacter sp. C4 TaxID=2992758 RepID=UPI00237B8CD0|nr:hypothetical protein [Halocynthiibacter sp. C4]MDE0591017.1 hypothetical protein [Halocynthiibacter sp. C4]